jgi:hypothetical protein
MIEDVKRMILLAVFCLLAGCGSGYVLVPEYAGRYAEHPVMKEILASWPETRQ